MSISLLVFIVLNFLAAMSGALFRPGRWYDALRKPSWQPPKWLFGPVWIVLYAMIAVSGWLVWTTAAPGEATVPMIFYGAQLLLNAAWSGLFFGMKRMDLAAGEMVLLWLAIVGTIVTFWPVHEGAAWMLLPYLAWVSFAFVLNITVWRLNPGNVPATASS